MKNSLINIKGFHCSSNCDLTAQILNCLGPNLKILCLQYFKSVDLEVIQEVIESRKSTMKEICFTTCIVPDNFLKSISLIKELNLSCIQLVLCKGFTYFGLSEFLKSQKNITKLVFKEIEPLSDDILLVISENLSQIRDLRLQIGYGSFAEVSKSL